MSEVGVLSGSGSGPGPGTPGRSKPPSSARMYACSRCPKTFKRSEHCSRHERGHTQEKPFGCHYCGRRYARKDLVSRHEKSFHPHADGINPRPVEPDEDVIVLHTRRSPSRTGPAPPDPSPAHNSTETTAALEAHAASPSRKRSRASPAGAAVTHARVSPPRLDLSPLEDASHSSGRYEGRMPFPVGGPPSTQAAHGTSVAADGGAARDAMSIVDRSTAENMSALHVDQSTTTSLDAWHPADMLWADADNGTGDALGTYTSTVGPNSSNAPYPVPDEHYFDNFDILSMTPRNGPGFEADFSSYLLHSGYTPVEYGDGQNGLPSGVLEPPLPPSSDLGAKDARAFPVQPKTAAADTNSESGTFARMPSVMTETPRKLPVPDVDAECYACIVADARSRLTPTELGQMDMLSSLDMQRFLTSYFTCFHRHCPIIHIPSLDLRTTPSHLIFAICAIGALYRLSRKTAKNLWYWADCMVEKELPVPSADLLSRSSTVSVQCRMLLGMYAIFSGDLTARAIARTGCLSVDYRARRFALALMPKDPASTTWEQWVSRETSKRLLYGIFIMSSLMTVTYDIAPAFSLTQDLEIEVLDEECLWEASTSQQWEALKKSQAPRAKTTVREAMTHLMYGKEESPGATYPSKWTAFATTMVFHAVNVNMWNVMQCTQSFTAFAVDEQNSKVLKTALVSQVETALARCYALLTADRSERDHTPDDPEGPLIFNCLALLRSAYARVFIGAGKFNRMVLLNEEPRQVSYTIGAYLAGVEERSPFLTAAVDKAYGGLLTPIKAGYLLVRKTAALSWSVEHAVAAWDCALFVTKWIHGMEMQQQLVPPNKDEMRNLDNFRELLSEVDSGYTGCGSLAGEVARIWAGFLDDTWVWGITPKMGQVLRQLSDAFKDDWNTRFPHGNPSGPISR